MRAVNDNGNPPRNQCRVCDLAPSSLELFQRAAGVSIQHVAYKGAGETVTAVLSGQATGMFSNPPPVISQIKAGKLRALGVAGSTRLPQLPDARAIGAPECCELLLPASAGQRLRTVPDPIQPGTSYSARDASRIETLLDVFGEIQAP